MLSRKVLIDTLVYFVGIFVVLHLFTTLVLGRLLADYYFYGLPFKYIEGGMCPPVGSCSDFYLGRLILDIVVWAGIALGLAYWTEKKKGAASEKKKNE